MSNIELQLENQNDDDAHADAKKGQVSSSSVEQLDLLHLDLNDSPKEMQIGKKTPEPLDDPYTKAFRYLEEHHILQIFQVLTSGIVYVRPADPLDYMLEQVEKLQNEGKFKVNKTEEH